VGRRRGNARGNCLKQSDALAISTAGMASPKYSR